MHPNTLDQMRVFHLVATEGSFSRAARRLNRGVSAVSYTIGALEDQLGFSLFDRSSRSPSLTPKGQTILHEAEGLLRRVERLEASVRALSSEVEQTLTIAVDTAFPETVLLDGLVQLQQAFPVVSIRVRRVETKRVRDEILEAKADLGLIAIERGINWNGIEAKQILAETMVLVAAADHALVQAISPVKLADLENHRQIYLADGWDEGDTSDYRVHPTDVWIVNSVESQLGLVERGLGWAFLPQGTARASLDRGTIAQLACSDIVHLPVRRFAACSPLSRPPGPTAQGLIASLTRV